MLAPASIDLLEDCQQHFRLSPMAISIRPVALDKAATALFGSAQFKSIGRLER
jgi:hypothetical protein